MSSVTHIKLFTIICIYTTMSIRTHLHQLENVSEEIRRINKSINFFVYVVRWM